MKLTTALELYVLIHSHNTLYDRSSRMANMMFVEFSRVNSVKKAIQKDCTSARSKKI